MTTLLDTRPPPEEGVVKVPQWLWRTILGLALLGGASAGVINWPVGSPTELTPAQIRQVKEVASDTLEWRLEEIQTALEKNRGVNREILERLVRVETLLSERSGR